ncbi:MAG: flavodoxin family protein [Candidatus Hermodarchaeota archaeon]
MKVLLLNGTLKQDSDIDKLYLSIVDELKSKAFEIDSILLRDLNVAACQGCFDCWVKHPGECRTADDGREIAKKMVQSNLIIHFTPITFGGYSSELKKVIDRFLPTILPFFTKREGETHHLYRYQNRASIIAIGFLNDQDEEKEQVFRELIYRNSLNMGAPIHEAIIFSKEQNESEFFDKFNTILQKVEVKI